VTFTLMLFTRKRINWNIYKAWKFLFLNNIFYFDLLKKKLGSYVCDPKLSWLHTDFLTWFCATWNKELTSCSPNLNPCYTYRSSFTCLLNLTGINKTYAIYILRNFAAKNIYVVPPFVLLCVSTVFIFFFFFLVLSSILLLLIYAMSIYETQKNNILD